MNRVSRVAAAILLSGFSLASMATQQVVTLPPDQQTIGMVNATGSSELTSLEQQLSGQIPHNGANALRTTLISGSSSLNGVTEQYR